MKQIVEYSVRIEKVKFSKHLFHLPQVLWGINLEICEFPPNKIELFEAVTFGGTFRKNVAGLNVLHITKDYIYKAAFY